MRIEPGRDGPFERVGGTGDVPDMQRLAVLRQHMPGRFLHTPGTIDLATSRSGDFEITEGDAPTEPTYIAPSDRHVVVVALESVGQVVTWLADEGLQIRHSSSGSVAILPAGEPMYLRLTHPQRALVLRIRPTALYGAQRLRQRLNGSLQGHGCLNEPVIEGLGRAMHTAAASWRHDCAEFLDAAGAALAQHLATRYMAVRGPLVGTLEPGIARLVFDYVEAQMDTRFRLETLASLTGHSVHHFCHVFKAATGKTPMSYVMERRMQRARELLETTDLSITAIAARVGFDSPSHFSNSFRAFWQASPSALRRARRSTAITGPSSS